MSFLKKIRNLILKINLIFMKIDDLQASIGRIEARNVFNQNSNKIKDFEFKIYSQWGEDGIIQFLIRQVPIEREIFIEFGVENYIESNTRFLLKNDNWSGLIIDSSQKNIEFIKKDSIYWRHNLKTECAFITKDNINNLLKKNGVDGDIGLLSIDLDGNDYWIWDSISCISPRIVICEYNSVFGSNRKLTIPYSESFIRNRANYSNLFYGASISALHSLGKGKGYSLIGSNSAGNNAFFVRNDLVGKLKICSPTEAYVHAQFRESRDRKGNIIRRSREESLSLIQNLSLYDFDTGELVKIREIIQDL